MHVRFMVNDSKKNRKWGSHGVIPLFEAFARI